jgi:hypothetical protein
VPHVCHLGVTTTSRIIEKYRSMRNDFDKSKDRARQAVATNQEIQKWVARRHGFVPETVWIEYCKQLFGITGSSVDEVYVPNTCPPERQIAIKQAFEHFHMLP